MSARLSTIVIDATDPVAQATWWGEVLGWSVTGTEEDGAVEIADVGGGVALLFEPVPEHKSLKNRLHLDIRPVGHDQENELRRLLDLGARHADIGQGDPTWFVLLDPEGNEFCLLRGRADHK